MMDHEGAAPRGRATRWLSRLPGLAAFALLGVVAYAGHAAGWKLPKPGTAGATKEDWCLTHNVPVGSCVECRKDLIPAATDRGWCKVHGVPECPEHHPELAHLVGSPATPRYDTAAAIRLFPRPENDKACKLHLRRVQFASADALRRAGVETAVVAERPMGEFLAANAEATFDPTRVGRVSSPVGGRAWWVGPELGQAVAKGQVLALVDAAEVGKLKGELLQALAQAGLRGKTVESLKASGGAVEAFRVLEAEAALTEARVKAATAEQALANLGLAVDGKQLSGLPPADMAARLRGLGLGDGVPESLTSQAPGSLLPLRSPVEGVIVRRDVVAGEVLDPAKLLFVVADPKRMWLTLHVRQEDASLVRIGQAVRFSGDESSPGVAGEVAWISPTVDERTRAVPVRATLPAGDARLPRDHTFGTARVVLREEPNAVTVPTAAVQWDGTCHIVFVRDRDWLKPGALKVFHVRKVVPGAKDATHTELLAGVLPGEVVATAGAAEMRAELMKANLGEGCACCK